MKLSIITINLNNSHGLKKTIDSVISQTFTDYEYIVIDGGSNDGSIDIIKQYANHISYWISEHDKGIYNAMNKGITQAKGDYCLFLNSADYLYANSTLETLFRESNNEDIIYGNLMLTNNYENIYPSTLTPKHFVEWGLPHPATIIRTKLFGEIGLYDEKNIYSSDHEFFIQAILKHKASYRHVNIPVTIFDNSGISSDPGLIKQQYEERYKILKRLLPFHYFQYRVKQQIKRFRKGVKKCIYNEAD